jgi:hypothetical protein
MATGFSVGGDIEQALGDVGVPSYVLDTTGVVRWINPAAERLVGDVRVASSPLSSRPRTAAGPASCSRGRCSAPLRPRRRPASWCRPPGSGSRWRSARRRSRAVNGWSASSGCWRNVPTTASQRHTPISPPAKSRCFVFWSRVARRSRSLFEHRNSLGPHPSSLPGSRRQLPTRSRRRRPGRIARLSDNRS